MGSPDQFPPDVQAKIRNQSRTAGPPGGIGGRASENAASAAARASAMGLATLEDSSDLAEAHPETLPEPVLQSCPRCGTNAPEAHNFCSKCGSDLMRGDFAARLGIKLEDSDIEDYIFKGYVARAIKIYGAHTITVKTAQPSDSHHVDNHVMNGAWRKDAKGELKPVSEIHMREQNQLALCATMVLKLDDKSLGDSVAARITYLEERGSAFVDLISKKAIWFQRAMTNHLQKADAFEGS